MSSMMLHAILEMPPALWHDSPLDIRQRHSAYVRASNHIADLHTAISGLISDSTVSLPDHTRAHLQSLLE